MTIFNTVQSATRTNLPIQFIKKMLMRILKILLSTDWLISGETANLQQYSSRKRLQLMTHVQTSLSSFTMMLNMDNY